MTFDSRDRHIGSEATLSAFDVERSEHDNLQVITCRAKRDPFNGRSPHRLPGNKPDNRWGVFARGRLLRTRPRANVMGVASVPNGREHQTDDNDDHNEDCERHQSDQTVNVSLTLTVTSVSSSSSIGRSIISRSSMGCSSMITPLSVTMFTR